MRKEYKRQRRNKHLENVEAGVVDVPVKDRERHKSNIRKLVRENTTLTSEVNKLRRELRSLDQKKRGGKNTHANSMTETSPKKSVIPKMKIEELKHLFRIINKLC